MRALGINPSRHGLDRHGIQNVNQVFWNLGTAALVENAIRRGEGLLAAGAVSSFFSTGARAGPFVSASPVSPWEGSSATGTGPIRGL